MKLQYLIAIFVAIMLPIVLILSQYVGAQVDVLSTKTKYDTTLLGATFDTMAAYEMNTRNISNSSVIGEDIREMEAVISTFSRSVASNLGLAGAANDYIISHIPAIAFCMYDGYYIYLPNENSSGTEKLQPYVYYSRTYENGPNTKITITYSLDNYVAIYGIYGGNSISAAGYLVVPDEVIVNGNFSYVKTTDDDGNIKYKVMQGSIKYKNIDIQKETIYENEPLTFLRTKTIDKDAKEETTDAMLYYYQAKEFTDKYNTVINNLSGEDRDKLLISEDNDPENEASPFMQEKVEVIKEAITTNLNRAIINFDGVNKDTYEMPQLNQTDWEKITNNISIVAFMKDIPLGNVTTYNKYVVVSSAVTTKFTNANAIDFVVYDTNGSIGKYHKINCEDLLKSISPGDKIVGYSSSDFEQYKTADEEATEYYYYYKHNEFADYGCEIGSIEKVNVATIADKIDSTNSNKDKLLKAYYTAVGRIRFRQVKASSYINMDNDINHNFTVEYKNVSTYHINTADSGNKYTQLSNNKYKTKYGNIEIANITDIEGEYALAGWKIAGGINYNEDEENFLKPGDILYSNANVTLEPEIRKTYKITYYRNETDVYTTQNKIENMKLKMTLNKIATSSTEPPFKSWRITIIDEHNNRTDITDEIYANSAQINSIKKGIIPADLNGNIEFKPVFGF